MHYKISILTSDVPTYTEEVYRTYSDAEKAFLLITEKGNYGIAEILSEEEIIEQANKIQEEENERQKRIKSEIEREEILQNEIVTAKVKGLNSESGFIEINGKTYCLYN